MKSLLLVVVVPLIASIAVNGVDIEGPEEGQNMDFTGATYEPFNTPFDMLGNRMLNIEGGEGQNKIELRSSSDMLLETLANAISIQFMALKTMKENQENTMRNLTNTISNQDMVLQTLKQELSDAISDQGMAVQIMKSNISDTISNEGMALQINQENIMSNLSDGFSNQENMFEIIEANQDIIMQNLTHLGCPEGFFRLSPSNQCLKFFYDQKRTWFEANSTCQSEGLVMAKPSDPLILRKYLVNKYGYNSSKGWPSVWLPARGSGSYFYWQPNGGRIESTNPYWYSTLSSSYTSSSNCVYMLNEDSYMKSYATKPYWYSACTSQYYYTICELAKE